MRATEEHNLAFETAQNVVEALQGEEFSEVFARFNATTADDPATGNSPGDGFAVRGLDARPGDADGLPGEILFPGNGTQLREDVADAELGMPRDLSGDDAVDAVDHSADYTILPVWVRVRWTGMAGPDEIEIALLLSNDKNAP